jgi:hypothetical protein
MFTNNPRPNVGKRCWVWDHIAILHPFYAVLHKTKPRLQPVRSWLPPSELTRFAIVKRAVLLYRLAVEQPRTYPIPQPYADHKRN